VFVNHLCLKNRQILSNRLKFLTNQYHLDRYYMYIYNMELDLKYNMLLNFLLPLQYIQMILPYLYKYDLDEILKFVFYHLKQYLRYNTSAKNVREEGDTRR
jgi:hypothetical protein